MADNNETGFKLNLDTKEFTEKALKAKKTLGEVWETESLQGWLSVAGEVGPYLAGLATLGYAFKAALDLTLEGEKIKQINQSFEALTQQAGISTEALKKGLEDAAHGLEDTEDLLVSASKAVVELGQNAKRLPEVFELSTKVSKVFGGEARDNFEAINRAISTGNTRILKFMGLNIDADKAMREYAKSIGTTAGALSEQGRQTALMNVVLAEGEKRFKDIKLDGESVTVMVKQAKVAWGEFKDGIAEFVEKSGAVKWILGGYRDLFSELGQKLKANFGSDIDQSNAKIEELTLKLADAKAKLGKLKLEGPNLFLKAIGAELTEKELERHIRDFRAELQKAIDENTKAVNEEKAKQTEDKKEDVPQKPLIDYEKERAKNAAFQREILAISEQRIQKELSLSQSREETENLLMLERINLEQTYAAKIEEIKVKSIKGEEMTKTQGDLMIVQLEAEKQLKLDALREQADDKIKKSYDNNLKHATSFWDGVEKAAARSTAVATIESTKFGDRGAKVFDTVKNHAVTAFMQMGEGSKTGAEIMKGFMFGSIADIAEAEGKLMIGRSVWPPQPPGLAGGAALLMLAGYLRSQAGGGAGSGGGGAGSGGGGSIDSGVPRSLNPEEPTKPEGTPQEKKSVTIQVQGNYFETEQTKTRMLEMIREATDATDFKYVQIGQR